MKRKLRMFCIAAALCSMMSFPAFAEETRESYQEKTTVLFEQMQELNAQIDTLREANNEMSTQYKSLCRGRKENGTLPVDQETWNSVKEIRQQISQYQSSKEESSVKEMRQAARTAAKGEDYESALATMEQVLQSKKDRLEKLQSANQLWLQIQELLAE